MLTPASYVSTKIPQSTPCTRLRGCPEGEGGGGREETAASPPPAKNRQTPRSNSGVNRPPARTHARTHGRRRQKRSAAKPTGSHSSRRRDDNANISDAKKVADDCG